MHKARQENGKSNDRRWNLYKNLIPVKPWRKHLKTTEAFDFDAGDYEYVIFEPKVTMEKNVFVSAEPQKVIVYVMRDANCNLINHSAIEKQNENQCTNWGQEKSIKTKNKLVRNKNSWVSCRVELYQKLLPKKTTKRCYN